MEIYKVSGCERSQESVLHPNRDLVGAAVYLCCKDHAGEPVEAIWLRETAPICEGLACTEFAAVSAVPLDSSEIAIAS